MHCFLCIQVAREDENEVQPVKQAVTVYSGVAVCGTHLESVLAQQERAVAQAKAQAEVQTEEEPTVKQTLKVVQSIPDSFPKP